MESKCPNCGHCPTCGRNNQQAGGYGYHPLWPYGPIWTTPQQQWINPQPWWQGNIQYYGTGVFTESGTTFTVSTTNNNGVS